MNLIEKLGGYEKAKGIRDINIQEFDGDASGVTIHYMGNSFLQEDLVSALLEHRRENNIFEVGDLVVFDDLMDISESVYKIKEIQGDQFILDNGWSIQSDMFRHATPEEIKAGHRL